MGLAFVNGTVRCGIGSPDTDRLYVEDGVIAEWPTELPADPVRVLGTWRRGSRTYGAGR